MLTKHVHRTWYSVAAAGFYDAWNMLDMSTTWLTQFDLGTRQAMVPGGVAQAYVVEKVRPRPDGFVESIGYSGVVSFKGQGDIAGGSAFGGFVLRRKTRQSMTAQSRPHATWVATLQDPMKSHGRKLKKCTYSMRRDSVGTKYPNEGCVTL